MDLAPERHRTHRPGRADCFQCWVRSPLLGPLTLARLQLIVRSAGNIDVPPDATLSWGPRDVTFTWQEPA